MQRCLVMQRRVHDSGDWEGPLRDVGSPIRDAAQKALAVVLARRVLARGVRAVPVSPSVQTVRKRTDEDR